MWEATEKYMELKRSFIRDDLTLNKNGLLKEIKKLFDDFDNIEKDLEKQKYAEELLKLKVKLDINLVRDTKCKYSITSSTLLNSIGNDFREIVFQNWGTYGKFRKDFLEQIAKVGQYFIKENGVIPHILTDIDDTLYANPTEHHGLAGSDESYTPLKPYPGIKKFYEIIKSKHNDTKYGEFYVTILSATPSIKKCKKFSDEKLNEIIGNNFSFLEGEASKTKMLLSGITGTVGATVENQELTVKPLNAIAGNTKFNKYKQYSLLFPEYSFIFIGDNGQGDIIAGERMVNDNPNCQVFLHNIIEKGKRKFNNTDIEERTTERMHFFADYKELVTQMTMFHFSEPEIKEIENDYLLDSLVGGKKKRTASKKNRKIIKKRSNTKRRQ